MVDITALKALNPLFSVVGQITKLKKAGSEWEGCCPLHGETRPSFYVNDRKGTYFCHSCNAAGDVITFIMEYNRVGFADAVAMLVDGAEFGNLSPPRVPKVTQCPGNGEYARSIWHSSGPIIGTPAELYLRNRGIDLDTLPPLSALRFNRLRHPQRDGEHAGLVAAISDPHGEVVAVQRIFLTDDGRKLDVETPKLSLGSRRGGAIRLGEEQNDLIICEGLEDGLSILVDMPEQAVWVAAGANMMKSIILPDSCQTVIIARDNDRAGERAAEDARATFLAAGRAVHVMAPPTGVKDFNEMISKRSMQ